MTPDQYHSCVKKVKYGHLETAQVAVDRMKNKARNTLEAYQCVYCHKYHIGRIRTGNLIQFRLIFEETGSDKAE